MLVDAMNRRWPAPLVVTAVGGERGGGTRITELGATLLRSYRDLQLQVEHLLDEASGPFITGLRLGASGS
jgi:molybdate transport repressor ModE-like protein